MGVTDLSPVGPYPITRTIAPGKRYLLVTVDVSPQIDAQFVLPARLIRESICGIEWLIATRYGAMLPYITGFAALHS